MNFLLRRLTKGDLNCLCVPSASMFIISVLKCHVWQIIALSMRRYYLYTVHFRIVYCSNFFNLGQQSAVTWNDIIGIQFFEYDTDWGTCLILTFSNTFLIDSCCDLLRSQLHHRSWRSSSRNVNHISYYSFRCVSGSVISTDMSECVANFCFASVVIFIWCLEQFFIRQFFGARSFFLISKLKAKVKYW